jgi:hypothetical protein
LPYPSDCLVDLQGAPQRYDEAYVRLRQPTSDTQSIANVAEDRPAALKREAASALVGGDEGRAFVDATLSAVTDLPSTPTPRCPWWDQRQDGSACLIQPDVGEAESS